MKTCMSDLSPKTSLWSRIHKEKIIIIIIICSYTPAYRGSRDAHPTPGTMSHECMWNRPTRRASHSDATEASVPRNVSVSSRSGLRRDLWKTSLLLSAHLGFHARYNAAGGPGSPALQSTRTTWKPCREVKKERCWQGQRLEQRLLSQQHWNQPIFTKQWRRPLGLMGGHVLKSNAASVVSIHL